MFIMIYWASVQFHQLQPAHQSKDLTHTLYHACKGGLLIVFFRAEQK
jgi:uncharacterized membrane protein